MANELVIAHPEGQVDVMNAAVLLPGPAVYLLANGIYKLMVYKRFPLSHRAGLVALLMLIPLTFVSDRLMINTLTTLIVIRVAGWESATARR